MSDVQLAITRRRRSEEEWRELISAWRASGKSCRAWSKEQGLSFESLRRWAKRLGGSEDISSVVELRREVPTSKSVDDAYLKVKQDGEVELWGVVSEELLRLVLRVVRETPHVH